MPGHHVTASAAFRAIGASHRLTVTQPAVLRRALDIAAGELSRLDAAASRFRPDSEVSVLARQAATTSGGRVQATVSPLLADYLADALEQARWTGGLVDPTLGRALVAAGYDADIETVRRRDRHTPVAAATTGTDFRDIALHGTRLTMPAGTLLDLGATAKARAADVIAARCASLLPGGFLVSLGGDCAAAGTTPRGGWTVSLQRHDGTTAQLLRTGAAVATSSTRHRIWRTDEGTAHHILDPRTRRPAGPVWATVTCLAPTALEANAASTAAVVLEHDAPAWLADRGIGARLEDAAGRVVTLPGWPGAEEPTAPRGLAVPA